MGIKAQWSSLLLYIKSHDFFCQFTLHHTSQFLGKKKELFSSHGFLNDQDFGLFYKPWPDWVARRGFFWLIQTITKTNEILYTQVICIDIFITTYLPDPENMDPWSPLGTKFDQFSLTWHTYLMTYMFFYIRKFFIRKWASKTQNPFFCNW